MILLMSNQMALQPCAIAATAEARLRANSRTAHWGITCKNERGMLVLEGQLSTFFQKQMAQEIVANIEGVVQVVNHIEVITSDRRRFEDDSASD